MFLETPVYIQRLITVYTTEMCMLLFWSDLCCHGSWNGATAQRSKVDLVDCSSLYSELSSEEKLSEESSLIVSKKQVVRWPYCCFCQAFKQLLRCICWAFRSALEHSAQECQLPTWITLNFPYFEVRGSCNLTGGLIMWHKLASHVAAGRWTSEQRQKHECAFR